VCGCENFCSGVGGRIAAEGVFPKEEWSADLGIEMKCLGCCSYGKEVCGDGSELGIGVPERNLGSHLLLVYFQLVAPFYQFGT
jgi:hypothetical protein